MQRRQRWIWRGRGSHLHKRVKQEAETGKREIEESPQATLEREAVRLLREWREMQEVVASTRQDGSPPRAQMREAEVVAFGWEEGEGGGDFLPTIRQFGVDGVLERLRGRGEV